MKKTLLAGIAVLFLATGTAHAESASDACMRQCGQDGEILETPQQHVCYDRCMKWPSPNFVADCRRDRLKIYFDRKDYEDNVHFDQKGGADGDNDERPGIVIDIDKAARTRLEKELRNWRKCDAYYQCLADRDAGKVKHCYANDKRWRDVYSGEL
jgi:hypothetical protein